MTFRVLFGIDALVALVVLYFFFLGLADGSVSSFNAGIWSVLLLMVAGVIAGGLWLRAAGHRRAAHALLLVLALPGIVYALFLVLVLVTHPRWN